MTTATTKTLAERVFATGIHGVTGKPTDEGWLEPGTLVRNVHQTGEVGWIDGLWLYRFDASTDGGQTWFTHEIRGEPMTA
jgi:hypothetical protein